jgi:hypothetical protein
MCKLEFTATQKVRRNYSMFHLAASAKHAFCVATLSFWQTPSYPSITFKLISACLLAIMMQILWGNAFDMKKK